MRLLESLEFKNYLNLKKIGLKGLKDFNIIIGPNNCGKTSILRGIALLQRIRFGRYANMISCNYCNEAFGRSGEILSLNGELVPRERYLGEIKASMIFGFNADEVEKLLPNIVKRRRSVLDSEKTFPTLVSTESSVEKAQGIKRDSVVSELENIFLDAEKHARNEFANPSLSLKENDDRKLVADHISFIMDSELETEVLKHTLFCPDARLESYKGKAIPEYIGSKNPPATTQSTLISLLREMIDPRMTDMRHNLDLVRETDKKRFDTAISEQGSGVKSLICLVADILSEGKNGILLIDEPELGLNPSGKHALLSFLLKQSREKKQVFLATHDPTFVNPVLWRDENVAVFLFSLISSDFVKIDLNENKEDPSVFAGYLPHTTSLKKLHIYVEGSLDVYIFQEFLEKYVRRCFEKPHKIMNAVGIYHLAGDFWSHLLYTIPRKPYSTIVVLDGDKKQRAEQVLSRYDEIEDRFQLFRSPSDIMRYKRRSGDPSMPCPVVCLKRPKIEDYLEPRNSPKEQGPVLAHMMPLPEEIREIFDSAFWLARIEKEIQDT